MFSIIKLFFLWLGAMAWHLGRIAILRPAYKNLSDTAGMSLSFLFVYFAAGLIRWQVISPMATGDAVTWGTFGYHVLDLVFYAVIVGLLYERARRGSSLFASVLGFSVVVDLTMSGLFLLGVIDTVKFPKGFGLAFELAISLVLAGRFAQEPAEVQKHGYGRKSQLAPVEDISYR